MASRDESNTSHNPLPFLSPRVSVSAAAFWLAHTLSLASAGTARQQHTFAGCSSRTFR